MFYADLLKISTYVSIWWNWRLHKDYNIKAEHKSVLLLLFYYLCNKVVGTLHNKICKYITFEVKYLIKYDVFHMLCSAYNAYVPKRVLIKSYCKNILCFIL